MVSAESFWTSSLRLTPEGGRITRILSAAINGIDPGMAVTRNVLRNGDMLTISGREYDLRSFHRVILLGMGKASLAMSVALANILADRLSDGLVISKQPSRSSLFAHDSYDRRSPCPR